jgi:hypothetical protein
VLWCYVPMDNTGMYVWPPMITCTWPPITTIGNSIQVPVTATSSHAVMSSYLPSILSSLAPLPTHLHQLHVVHKWPGREAGLITQGAQVVPVAPQLLSELRV